MSLSIWNTKNLRNFSTGQSERGGGLCTEVWEGKAREVRQSQELGATKAKERAASYMEPCWGGGDEGKETMTARARQKSRHPEDDSSGSVVGCRPGWSGMRREDKKVQIAAAEVWLWREGEISRGELGEGERISGGMWKADGRIWCRGQGYNVRIQA